eukprot:TRINITY_DN1563_c0_g1_i4.p1 TRINITY_DN1563_c0_g1~~TRINITY_DN1563_c0_g1_i4.p1  ORF type:complete len:320 (-),score=65.26 TRINITY_DN1563_c0_g1_i4:20-979(-)
MEVSSLFSFDEIDLTPDTNPVTLKLHLLRLASVLQSGEGTEDQWKSLVTANSHDLIHKFGKILDLLAADDEEAIALWLQIMSVLSTLDAAHILPILSLQYPLLPRFVRAIQRIEDPEVINSRLEFLVHALAASPIEEVYFDEKFEEDFDMIIDLTTHRSDMVTQAAIQLLVLLDSMFPQQYLLYYHTLGNARATFISESIMQLANRAQGDLLRLTLRLIGRMLVDPDVHVFFFSSDVVVLIQVILRQLQCLQIDDPILLDYLCCLEACLNWPEYPSNEFHKQNEIFSICSSILDNADEQNHADVRAKIIEMFPQIDQNY